MKLRVRVQPGSRHPGIERLSDGTWRVKVRAPAQEGKANRELVQVLAEHFRVPRSQVRILHGELGRFKLVEIQGL